MEDGSAFEAVPNGHTRSHSRRWIAIAVIFFFVFFCSVMWLLFGALHMVPNTLAARVRGQETGVVRALQEISSGEQRYLAESPKDTDGDSVPDYGTLSDLVEHDLIPAYYNLGAYSGHIFQLRLTPSAKGGGTPHFVCAAVPLSEDDERYARRFSIDETGEIQIASTQENEMPPQFVSDRAETGATINLRSVLEAEKIYLETTAKDKDNDGVPDYGTIADLQFGVNAVDSEYYVVNVTTLDSASNNGTPTFTCVAQPRPSYSDLPTYSIDQTGVITSVSGKTAEAQNTSTQNGSESVPVAR